MDASPLFPRFEVPLTGRSRFAADAALADALADAAAAACRERIDDAALAASASTRRAAPRPGRQRRPLRLHRGRERRAARALPDALAVEMEGAARGAGVRRLRPAVRACCAPSPTAPTTARTSTSRRFIDEVAARRSRATSSAPTLPRLWVGHATRADRMPPRLSMSSSPLAAGRRSRAAARRRRATCRCCACSPARALDAVRRPRRRVVGASVAHMGRSEVQVRARRARRGRARAAVRGDAGARHAGQRAHGRAGREGHRARRGRRSSR